MTPSEAGQTTVWIILTWVVLWQFQKWATRRPSPNTMEWAGQEAERALEVQQFASHRNRSTESALPVVMGDYDCAPFALDVEREA